jgi:uncharacterized RDD family membrane protein YckC
MPDSCPTCGSQLQYTNAEICPHCGVRIHEPPKQAPEKYGGFWIRLVAHLIDSLILFMVNIAVFFALLFVYSLLFGGSSGSHDTGFLVIFILWLLFMVIFNWLYYAFQESSSRQATIGKQLMGLTVTDYGEKPISFWTATGRWAAKILSGLTLNLGYIMIGFTEKKQGLHDYLVHTYVIKKTGSRNCNLVAKYLVIAVFACIILFILASVFVSFMYGTAHIIPKTKIVTVTAEPRGDDILLTYHGGQDTFLVSELDYGIIGSPGSETVWESPRIGEQKIIRGATSGKDHIIVSAKFTDGTEQLILDNYI